MPAIIRWPGHLPEGEVRSQMAHSCDWLPTLAELCGVELPATTLHGESLADVIRTGEKDTPHEVLHWKMGNDQWAVRQGPWKLIHRPNPAGDGPELTADDREWFLANIDEDPGETTNLTRIHPAIVDRLRQLAK